MSRLPDVESGANAATLVDNGECCSTLARFRVCATSASPSAPPPGEGIRKALIAVGISNAAARFGRSRLIKINGHRISTVDAVLSRDAVDSWGPRRSSERQKTFHIATLEET